MSIEQYRTDSLEALEAIASPEPKIVWIHDSITYIYTGEDIPPEAPSGLE